MKSTSAALKQSFPVKDLVTNAEHKSIVNLAKQYCEAKKILEDAERVVSNIRKIYLDSNPPEKVFFTDGEGVERYVSSVEVEYLTITAVRKELIEIMGRKNYNKYIQESLAPKKDVGGKDGFLGYCDGKPEMGDTYTLKLSSQLRVYPVRVE